MTQKIIVIGLLSCMIAFIGCQNDPPESKEPTTFVAKQITIDALENQLILLQNGKTEYDFFGITSNGIDCIYFMKEGDKYQIEFEAMDKEQVPYFNVLKDFGKRINVKTVEKTYGNQPNFNALRKAQVLRFEINGDIQQVSEIGKQIQSEIFENNDHTKYEIVP